MIMCLVTSQQRSGPNSVVGRFLLKDPFPITYENIKNETNRTQLIKKILQENHLTRYINRISNFFNYNINLIEDDNWRIIQNITVLIDSDSKATERSIADSLNDVFYGFGPKQSRNFLQSLGLTKYEIPIDSRITNWLNNFGFPVTLNSSALGDKAYYHFVSDGIQALCEAADIYPCLFDAAIFSSYDKDKWTEDNTRF